MKIITNPSQIDDILNRGTIVEILPSKESFRKVLLSGKKLRFYIGFDATAPTLHLSHAKNIMLMEKFRQLGHEVIILFGDFTAMIGDPTDKLATRKQLSRTEVLHNVKKWKALIKPLINFQDAKNPPKIMYNYKWLSKIKLQEIIELSSNFTVQQMIERDMFQTRLTKQKPIYLHEFLYPLLQGYDSVAMNVDVEVCGTDQIFNALIGRSLLQKIKEKEKYIVAVTLMENPKTGELMSKSKKTGVFLDTTPQNLYGQIMAQPDEMIKILFINNTLLSLEEINNIINNQNPRDAKAHLAFEITKLLHGEKQAKKAAQEFNAIFQKKELPTVIPEITLPKTSIPILELLTKTKLTSSKSEAQRLILQNGVKINGIIQNDWKKNIQIETGMIIQIGKRKFIKII